MNTAQAPSLQTRIIEGLMCDQTAGRYTLARRLMPKYPEVAHAIADYLDAACWFDEVEDAPELTAAARQWKLERKLVHDVDVEVAAIKSDGMRGYHQDNGMLTVVHPSAKNPGWWQATVYNTRFRTINSDTQHETIEDVFGVRGADICPRAKALRPDELAPLMQVFIGAKT